MHLVRLEHLLKQDFTIMRIDESHIIKDNTFNIRSKKFLQYLRIILQSDIVHIHSGHALLRITHLLASRLLCRKHIIVTLHAAVSLFGLKVIINRLLLRLAHRVIAVSGEIQNRLRLSNIIVKPAFIPPDIKSEPPLPKELANWLEKKHLTGQYIISGNAYQIDTYNGLDMYGIDLCLDLMRSIVHEHQLPVALIFIISSLKNSEQKFHEYTQFIKDWGLEKHVLLTHVDTSFVRLIEKSDIVIRPTCTDGDALTIREALFMGIPVVASDVVKRPEHTVTFRNRDAGDFKKKILEVLDGKVTKTSTGESPEDYAHFYKMLYCQASIKSSTNYLNHNE